REAVTDQAAQAGADLLGELGVRLVEDPHQLPDLFVLELRQQAGVPQQILEELLVQRAASSAGGHARPPVRPRSFARRSRAEASRSACVWASWRATSKRRPQSSYSGVP